jgi:hypothetical protein
MFCPINLLFVAPSHPWAFFMLNCFPKKKIGKENREPIGIFYFSTSKFEFELII